MKPGMLFSIVLLTAIALAASFGLHVMPIEPLYQLTDAQAANALYVCPAASSVWDAISSGIRPYIRYINMAFFFAIMLTLFSWAWALYQNLLQDKFDKKAFDKPWALTKTIFWMAAIIIILIGTPNSYRSVHIQGVEGKWVLCENNTPGALPVLADAVKR